MVGDWFDRELLEITQKRFERVMSIIEVQNIESVLDSLLQPIGETGSSSKFPQRM